MSPTTTEPDEFVNIWMDVPGERRSGAESKSDNEFYDKWVDQSTAKLSNPPITGTETLRQLYPKHSLILTNGYGMNILGFPGASATPLDKTPLVTNLFFVPLARSLGLPGILIDQVQFGAFKLTWRQYEFIVYLITYPTGFSTTNQYFILHEGPEEVSRLLLLSAGSYADELHDEIWVFNQGFWQKDHGLWVEIQKAHWKDVILKEEFKKALQKDVYGFFASEAIYKELAIPWKRGLIMYGPPGNGKTISLKTVMKTCGEKGFAPLYVKSFQSWKGEEGAMADVFDKARQLSPCVIILEDLDSLINDRNRSFFLNQLDGLEGNDGLLIIGTTNHFDRLDPGLSTRPSRFDRKYKFDDPDEEERTLYIQYWQKKLKTNKDVEFPDPLVAKVANLTARFSSAYLKEAFVSSLVTLAGIEGPKPKFESILMKQIDDLRRQLDKQFMETRRAKFEARVNLRDDESRMWQYEQTHSQPSGRPSRPPRPDSSKEYDVRALLDALSECAPRVDSSRHRVYRSSTVMDDQWSSVESRNQRNVRDLLDALSDSLGFRDPSSRRLYEAPLTSTNNRTLDPPSPQPLPNPNTRDYLDWAHSHTVMPQAKPFSGLPSGSGTSFTDTSIWK